MGIISIIRDKIAVKRAEANGIDPVKYKNYLAAKKKELFIKGQEIERKREEKIMQQKADLRNKQEIEKLKNRGGSSLIGAALKSYGKRLQANKKAYQPNNTGSQGLNFGLGPSDNKPMKRGPFQL